MKDTFRVAAVILIIFAVSLGFIVIAGDTVGLTDDDARTLASILPGITAMFIGFMGITWARGMWKVGPVIGIGIGFLAVVYELDSAALLIPDLVMTAREIQLVSMVVVLIIAVYVAAVKGR